MKRYSIVRVDGNHKPSHFEVERIENIADLKLLDNVVKTYGDTKEQFTRKIETAIEIAINRYEQGLIVGKNKNRQCAEIIVEFLGVE